MLAAVTLATATCDHLEEPGLRQWQFAIPALAAHAAITDTLFPVGPADVQYRLPSGEKRGEHPIAASRSPLQLRVYATES